MTLNLTKPFWLLVVLGCCWTVPALIAAQEDKKDKPPLQELMEEAIGYLRDQEVEEALDVLRDAVNYYPNELEPSFGLIQILQQAGMEAAEEDRKSGNKYFYEAAKLARVLAKKDEVPPQAASMLGSAVYNEACSLAVDGKDKAALKSLREAFEMGFEDIEVAKEDSDFGDLSKTKEFKALIKEAAAIAEKRRAEALAKEIAMIKEEMAEFESFDFDFKLNSTDGDEIKLADFKDSFLIVDFWGTWCGPCVMEIPHFNKLKKNYGEKGLEIVGIAYENTEDEEEAAEKVNAFMERKKVNYKSVIGDDATSEQIEIEGYPTTLFIGKDGKVKFKVVGYHEYEVLEAITKELMKDPMEK